MFYFHKCKISKSVASHRQLTLQKTSSSRFDFSYSQYYLYILLHMDVCNPNKHREYTLILPFSNLGINLYYIINNFYRNIKKLEGKRTSYCSFLYQCNYKNHESIIVALWWGLFEYNDASSDNLIMLQAYYIAKSCSTKLFRKTFLGEVLQKVHTKTLLLLWQKFRLPKNKFLFTRYDYHECFGKYICFLIWNKILT